jgi:hypothetical protein
MDSQSSYALSSNIAGSPLQFTKIRLSDNIRADERFDRLYYRDSIAINLWLIGQHVARSQVLGIQLADRALSSFTSPISVSLTRDSLQDSPALHWSILTLYLSEGHVYWRRTMHETKTSASRGRNELIRYTFRLNGRFIQCRAFLSPKLSISNQTSSDRR